MFLVITNAEIKLQEKRCMQGIWNNSDLLQNYGRDCKVRTW